MTIFLIILGFIVGIPALIVAVKALIYTTSSLINFCNPFYFWKDKIAKFLVGFIRLVISIILVWVIIQFDLIPGFIQILNKN